MHHICLGLSCLQGWLSWWGKRGSFRLGSIDTIGLAQQHVISCTTACISFGIAHSVRHILWQVAGEANTCSYNSASTAPRLDGAKGFPAALQCRCDSSGRCKGGCLPTLLLAGEVCRSGYPDSLAVSGGPSSASPTQGVRLHPFNDQFICWGIKISWL